jgi:hypothetical protein
MQKTETFKTNDLYLSSALKIHGFRLLTIEKDVRGRGTFIFEDRPNRSDVVTKYFSGELTGSLKEFANAWSDLKTLINQTY